LSVHLLMRSIIGLHEEEADSITIAPLLPHALRQVGAIYRVGSVPWGDHNLSVECTVRDAESYTAHVRRQSVEDTPGVSENVQQWSWEGVWGEGRTLSLPSTHQIFRE